MRIVCSVGLWASGAVAVQAQAEAPRAPAVPRGGVALIDLGTIVDQSNHFQQMAASWKHDVKAAEERMETEGEYGNQLLERMKDYAGSQEYKKAELYAYHERADFQRRWSKVYDDFEVRKAKMYYAIRAEAKDDARHYAQQHGISLVLHYDSAPVDPKDPKSIVRALNKAVFYQSDRDITPVVLQEMNRRVPAVAVPTQQAAGSARQPAPPASTSLPSGPATVAPPPRTATSRSDNSDGIAPRPR